MRKIKFIVLVILMFSASGFSQTIEKEKKQIEIDICQPSITEAGRQSSFYVNYTYMVMTDKSGLIKDVKELTDHKKFRSLMNDEKVIPCIEGWKLKPLEKYTVRIGVGTTGDEKSLNILSKTVKIKFIL